MTAEELKSQIKSLEDQLKSLSLELRESQSYQKIPQNITETKNYKHFLDEAEGAFLKKEYLEAFLIQSCIIEGVLKKYASTKLSSIVSQSVTLKNKFKSFEFARIIDELLISRKIKKDLYENLDTYRRKRNEVIHDLLEYKDKKELDEELKKAYELGRHMKGSIVDDISEEIKEGLTASELDAQIEVLLVQLNNLQQQLISLEEGGKNKLR